MQQIDKTITDKLQEIIDIRTELKLHEDAYTAFLKADVRFEKLKRSALK